MNKTCSLELSKKLYEAGLKLKTEKYFHPVESGIRKLPKYSTDELLEVMPFRIRLADDDYWLWMTKLKHGGLDVRYIDSRQRITHCYEQDDIFSEALGKMCLWLLQNGYHYLLDKKELLKNE